jgi:hypothetical protein
MRMAPTCMASPKPSGTDLVLSQALSRSLEAVNKALVGQASKPYPGPAAPKKIVKWSASASASRPVKV